MLIVSSSITPWIPHFLVGFAIQQRITDFSVSLACFISSGSAAEFRERKSKWCADFSIYKTTNDASAPFTGVVTPPPENGSKSPLLQIIRFKYFVLTVAYKVYLIIIIIITIIIVCDYLKPCESFLMAPNLSSCQKFHFPIFSFFAYLNIMLLAVLIFVARLISPFSSGRTRNLLKQ